mgnify:CR=1 FL=1
MDEELWFEEEIGPAEGMVETLAKRLDPAALPADEAAELRPLLDALEGLTKGQRAAAVRERYRGIIRVFRPGVLRLAAGAPAPPAPGGDALPYARGAAWLVRLSVEFDLPAELKEAQYRYKKVYCRATLSADDDRCRPAVLEVYPDRLYQGEPQTVKVEFKPTLKAGPFEGSAVSFATDVRVGVVAPATVGFLGDGQLAPYWEMTEKEQAILGRYHFWFVLDVPPGCDLNAVSLGVLAEGDLRFHIGPIPMGPKVRQREGLARPLRLGTLQRS